MDITIGIKHVARELTIQSLDTMETLRGTIAAALADSSGTLTLIDDHERVTIIPSQAIGYVQIGPEGPRRVGFGAV
ncbi:MAG: DUF3107 domain-containing protein [Bifidobacteriaceae bacterium]|nr:DUF3107 domain-containing protein [Bifidobacteriaceae bacterium]